MLAVALALGCSVSYGCANYLGPRLAQRFPFGTVLLVGQLAALASAAALVAGTGEAVPDPHHVLLALLAGAGNALGLIGFFRAAELGPISRAAPIGATGAVLPVVWGVAHGDRLSGLEAVGLVLALTGIVLAARRPAGAGVANSAEARDLRRSVVFALASAVGFGILLIALPPASAGGRWWALLDARTALVACVVVLVVRRDGAAMTPARSLPRLALPGLLLLGGTVLYLLAVDRGQLSEVSVLASLNPVFTVALAFVLAGERLARIQLTGVAAAVAGVVLIAA